MTAWADGDRALSVSEAAQLTGASSKSLRRRIERGTLGSVRQGTRRLIPMSELVRTGLLDSAGGRPDAFRRGAPAATGFEGNSRFAAAQPGGHHFAGAGEAPHPGLLASRPLPSPVPGPRPSALPAPSEPRAPAPPPRLRAPWVPGASPAGGRFPGQATAPPTPSPPPEPPAAPAVVASAPAPAAPHPDRRVTAILELVMHQTRTINALNARLARLEKRLDQLLHQGD